MPRRLTALASSGNDRIRGDGGMTSSSMARPDTAAPRKQDGNNLVETDIGG
jgi:hypothetical protein